VPYKGRKKKSHIPESLRGEIGGSEVDYVLWRKLRSYGKRKKKETRKAGPRQRKTRKREPAKGEKHRAVTVFMSRKETCLKPSTKNRGGGRSASQRATEERFREREEQKLQVKRPYTRKRVNLFTPENERYRRRKKKGGRGGGVNNIGGKRRKRASSQQGENRAMEIRQGKKTLPAREEGWGTSEDWVWENNAPGIATGGGSYH